MSNITKDSNGKDSSRRIAGFVVSGVGLSFLVAVGVTAIFRPIGDSATALEVGKIIFVGGLSLLGIGVFEFFGGKK